MAQTTRPDNRGLQQPQQQAQHRSASAQLDIKFTRPLDPELFNGKAKQAAKHVRGNDDRVNKPTQLRRFYDELCMWEEKVNRQREKFDEYLPFIRMLNAKAAYAEGRRLVDHTFVNLLHQTLAEVKNAETLTTCKLFWEAFMGFYKQERPDKQERPN